MYRVVIDRLYTLIEAGKVPAGTILALPMCHIPLSHVTCYISYLIRAVVDPLRDFSINYYKKYPKLGKKVLNVIKAAQMKENQSVAVV